MKGKSTWERAEAMVNLAHPMFRDELIKQARNEDLDPYQPHFLKTWLVYKEDQTIILH